MKKSLTFLILILCAALSVPLNAATATFSLNNTAFGLSSTGQNNNDQTQTSAPVTLTISKASASNGNNFQSNHVRFQAKATLTVAVSSGYKITGLTISYNTSYSSTFTCTPSGSSITSSSGTATWSVGSATGDVTTIVVTNNASSQARITSATVTYETAGGGTPTAPGAVSASAGGTALSGTTQELASAQDITLTSTNATIFYYTTDGNNPTTGSSNVSGSGTATIPANTFSAGNSYTLKVLPYNGSTAGTMATFLFSIASGGGTTGNVTFDFEDTSAHNTSGSNSYTGTNTYTENGATITLTYADAVNTGSPLSGSWHIVGRVAKNTTNSPTVVIGNIDLSGKTITAYSFKTKGLEAMTMLAQYSTDGGSTWTNFESGFSMPTTATTKDYNSLSISGTNTFKIKFTVTVESSTRSNRDFNLDDIVITYQDSNLPQAPDAPSITGISDGDEVLTAPTINISFPTDATAVYYKLATSEITTGPTKDDKTGTFNSAGTIASSNFTAGNTYYIKAVAYNEGGYSPVASLHFTYRAAIAPVAPTLTDEFTFWPRQNDAASASVTITPAAGNTVYYTINGSTPTTSGTGITEATTITINATTTVKAISSRDGSTTSVVSKTYTLGTTVTGIGEFRNLASGTTARLYLPDNYNARVMYVNGSEVYVRDNTGAICIYGLTANPTMAYNQHLVGWITGTYTSYNGLPEFTVASGLTNTYDLAIADKVTETDTNPVVIDAEDFSDHHADWITLKDMRISVSGNTITASDDSNNDVRVYNKFNAGSEQYYQAPYADALVDLTGIAIPYNNINEIAPMMENGNRPLVYVINSEQDFTSPSSAITSANVRLGRTLYADRWNALTLPIAISNFDGEIYEYTGVTAERQIKDQTSGELLNAVHVVLAETDAIEAGVPYLVKPTANMTDPVFTNTTLTATTAQTVSFVSSAAAGARRRTATTNTYELVGTYSPTTVTDTDKSTHVFDNDGEIVWASTATEVPGSSAYMQTPANTALLIQVGDDVITSIDDLYLQDLSTILNDENAEIYNIMGQRMNPPFRDLPRGVYIVNGIKVVK